MIQINAIVNAMTAGIPIRKIMYQWREHLFSKQSKPNPEIQTTFINK